LLTDPYAGRGRALTRDEAHARAALISECNASITFDLTTGDHSFRSTSVLRFRCSQPGASTFVELTATVVHAVELNGRPVAPETFDGTRLDLEGLGEHNELRVVADFPYSNIGTGLHRFVDPVDGADYVWSHFEPHEGHRAFACFDQPDIKARFDIAVIAPAGWEVASNMAPIERPEPDQAGRWAFLTTPVMSSYLAALIAGPFHVVRQHHGAIELGVWCRRSLAEHVDADADEIFEITRQGLDFFEDLFAHPYAWGPKYDQAFVPQFNAGAMENAGLVTFNELYVFRGKVTDATRENRAQTILHELAHMWFGDLVTMRWWDDLWLNESFATYMGHLAQERATRFTNSWTTFAKRMKTWAYAQDQLPTTHPIVSHVEDTETAHVNFDGISYAKGASVLKQLVAWVGEEAFVKGVRDYFRRYAFGNADLASFLGCLAESSGRDLTSWSVDWLETAGVNTIVPRLEVDGDRYASVSLVQTASESHPTLRAHRLAIGLYDLADGHLVRRQRLEVDVAGDLTPIPMLTDVPVPDLLLANDEDLAYTKIRLGERSLRTATEQLAALDDDLARSLCWTAAWDMVRDAEMRARDFVGMFLRNGHAETDVGVVVSLVHQSRDSISIYSDPANRRSLRERFAGAALEATREARPGSDLQLAWVRAFIGAARSDEHLGLLEQVLAGDAALDGLAVDTDVRWAIVGTLALTGRGDGAIDRELDRDPTDAGHRNAAAARASRPSAQAKAEAWAALLDPDLPLAMARAMMGAVPHGLAGFTVAEQAELLHPYRAAYFQMLPKLWGERNPEVAMTIARWLYPASPDEELLALTDRFLQRERPPAQVARVLVEARDEAARALRAQAFDARP